MGTAIYTHTYHKWGHTITIFLQPILSWKCVQNSAYRSVASVVKALWNSGGDTYYNLFNHFSVNGHLECFHSFKTLF